jgi:DNA-binding NarL/FixJ family response regulator
VKGNELIRVRLVLSSPALSAGVRSLLAADAQIVVEETDTGGNEPSNTQTEVDVIITAPTSFEFDSKPISFSPTAPAFLLLAADPIRIQRLLHSAHTWGVVHLDASAQELSAAVRGLAAGLFVGSTSLLSATDDPAPSGGPLTARESEVLGLLSKGLANKQIALELGISEHTVKFHVASIYTKLNATSRTQAVWEGLRNGWIVL